MMTQLYGKIAAMLAARQIIAFSAIVFLVSDSWNTNSAQADEPALPEPVKARALHLNGFSYWGMPGTISISVEHNRPEYTTSKYCWGGVFELWAGSGEWEWADETQRVGFNNWRNDYYYHGDPDYYVIKILNRGDGIIKSDHREDEAWTEIWFWIGGWGWDGTFYPPSVWVEDSDGNHYYVDLYINGELW